MVLYRHPSFQGSWKYNSQMASNVSSQAVLLWRKYFTDPSQWVDQKKIKVSILVFCLIIFLLVLDIEKTYVLAD
mgnify:FL=1